jgi:hypothetical protein
VAHRRQLDVAVLASDVGQAQVGVKAEGHRDGVVAGGGQRRAHRERAPAQGDVELDAMREGEGLEQLGVGGEVQLRRQRPGPAAVAVAVAIANALAQRPMRRAAKQPVGSPARARRARSGASPVAGAPRSRRRGTRRPPGGWPTGAAAECPSSWRRGRSSARRSPGRAAPARRRAARRRPSPRRERRWHPGARRPSAGGSPRSPLRWWSRSAPWRPRSLAATPVTPPARCNAPTTLLV